MKQYLISGGRIGRGRVACWRLFKIRSNRSSHRRSNDRGDIEFSRYRIGGGGCSTEGRIDQVHENEVVYLARFSSRWGASKVVALLLGDLL